MGPIITIGLDIGGTRTTGLCGISSSESVVDLKKIDEIGLNLKIAGVDAVSDLIIDITVAARKSYMKISRLPAGHSAAVVVCAGIAGAGSENDRRMVSIRFQNKSPGDLLIIHTDTFVALEGAFRGESGMIFITGTGSSVCARDRRGRIVSAGGWGRLIGDPASGYQIGLRCLRILGNRLDSTGTEKLQLNADDIMLNTLVTDFGLSSRETVIQSVYDSPASTASLARVVLSAAKRGDNAAQAILVSEIRSFVDQIVRLTQNLTLVDKHYVHMGGLREDDHFAEMFKTEMQRQLPEWEPALARNSPAEGALRLAQSLAATV